MYLTIETRARNGHMMIRSKILLQCQSGAESTLFGSATTEHRLCSVVGEIVRVALPSTSSAMCNSFLRQCQMFVVDVDISIIQQHIELEHLSVGSSGGREGEFVEFVSIVIVSAIGVRIEREAVVFVNMNGWSGWLLRQQHRSCGSLSRNSRVVSKRSGWLLRLR